MDTAVLDRQKQREIWLNECWGDSGTVNGVPFDDAARTLRTCGYIPGVTLDQIAQRNLEIRERMFHEQWGGRLVIEEQDIPNGALVLQEMGLIPSV